SVGAVDAKQIPLSTIASRFALRDDVLALDSIVAALEGGGSITGSARIPLGGAVTGGAWTFEVRDIDAHRIYAALVRTGLCGSLNGRMVAAGSLAPPLNVRAEVTLARGTRLSGIALAGTGRRTFTDKSVRDIAVDLAAGHSKLTATGAAGAAGDHLMVGVDSP